MAVTLRYHVYIPDYELQGPTIETRRPIDKALRQRMLHDFFDWIKKGKGGAKAEQGMKRAVIREDIDLKFREGFRRPTRSDVMFMSRIRKRYGLRPKPGLTTKEYKDIYSGKKYAAKWFED